MTPLVIGASALLLGLVVGGVVVWGTPVFGIPIVAIAILVIAAVQFRRSQRDARSMGRQRETAEGRKVEFTERDRETLSDRSPGDGA